MVYHNYIHRHILILLIMTSFILQREKSAFSTCLLLNNQHLLGRHLLTLTKYFVQIYVHGVFKKNLRTKV